MHPPAPPHGRIGRNKSAGWLSVRIDALLCALDLTGVSLVGHSMGTGEITRYIGKFGTKQLRKAVLIGTLGPYLVKAPDNPEGADASGIQAGIKADRPAAMREFLKNFYSVGGADGKLFSDLVIQANWIVAIGASPVGMLTCVDAWLEDSLSDAAHMDERSTARACSDHLYA